MRDVNCQRHLLGKKSWNVYNQENIDKVKRDEAIAKAVQDAEEEAMQDVDSARRLAILRGEEPLALIPAPPTPSTSVLDTRHGLGSGRERKKRKRADEDATDFEMRVATEEAAASSRTETQLILRRPTSDAPVTDVKGHIDLFPRVAGDTSATADVEVRKAEEVAKRRKDYERDYTVKFSDAAGFKQGMQQPWYSKDGRDEDLGAPTKDVWGNEDPRRRERETARVVSSDPLAMMKQGASKVRQVEKERRRRAEEREREILEIERVERDRRKRRRKHRDESDVDELEGFNLEASDDHTRHKSRHGGSRRREHKHRDRSRDRDKGRSHHRV